MSISNALGSALSGLSASARAASVVSSNVANANTDGYGVRRLAVTSMTYGTYGGVRVVGITRDSDPVLTGQRRDAGADGGVPVPHWQVQVHQGGQERRVEDLVLRFACTTMECFLSQVDP